MMTVSELQERIDNIFDALSVGEVFRIQEGLLELIKDWRAMQEALEGLKYGDYDPSLSAAITLEQLRLK